MRSSKAAPSSDTPNFTSTVSAWRIEMAVWSQRKWTRHLRPNGSAAVSNSRKVSSIYWKIVAEGLAQVEQTQTGQPRVLQQPSLQKLLFEHGQLLGGHFTAIGAKLVVQIAPGAKQFFVRLTRA